MSGSMLADLQQMIENLLVISQQHSIAYGVAHTKTRLTNAAGCTRRLNVLDKFPKSVQPNAHKDLREIWLAPDRPTAETAIA